MAKLVSLDVVRWLIYVIPDVYIYRVVRITESTNIIELMNLINNEIYNIF